MLTKTQQDVIVVIAVTVIFTAAVFASTWLVAMFVELDLFWPVSRGWRIYLVMLALFFAATAAAHVAERDKKEVQG